MSGAQFPPDEVLGLTEDSERLAQIGELILAGASMDEFGLTRWERIVVAGYVRAAMGEVSS